MSRAKKKRVKIVLYTLPPVPNSYSFSPFGLKAESFLRINNLSYEICYTTNFGNNGTIPYVRLFDCSDSDDCSGDTASAEYEEIPDSNEMIVRLLKDPWFETPCNDGLTKEQAAISHACLRMLEEHTAQIGFYFRYGLHMPEFCAATQLRERLYAGDESRMSDFMFFMFRKFMPKGNMKRAAGRGFLRYGSKEALWSMSFDDLQALENLLQSKGSDGDSAVYFFGRTSPSVLDCAAFGHLSQFLYIAIDFPQKKYLTEHCPGLIRFMDNFKETFFPDWELKCQKQPNDYLRKDNPQRKKKIRKLQVKLGGVLLTALAVVGLVYFVGTGVPFPSFLVRDYTCRK